MAYVGPILLVLFVLGCLVFVLAPEDPDVQRCRERRQTPEPTPDHTPERTDESEAA